MARDSRQGQAARGLKGNAATGRCGTLIPGVAHCGVLSPLVPRPRLRQYLFCRRLEGVNMWDAERAESV